MPPRPLALAAALVVAQSVPTAAGAAAAPRVQAAPECHYTAATIVGPGDGTIVGTPGTDIIVTAGATVVDAGGGGDYICVTGSTAAGVSVVAGDGDDLVDLEQDWTAPLTLDAGPGRDQLVIGSLAARRATLDVPRARLVDDDGVQPEVATVGFESYLIGAGDSRRVTFRGSAASEYFRSDACLVRAFGHRGRDDLEAGPLSENRCDPIRGVMYGGRGRDVLAGATGAAHGRDRLIGGKGRDHADGGRGRDLCRAEVRVSCERR